MNTCTECNCQQVVINTSCCKVSEPDNNLKPFQIDTLFEGKADVVNKNYALTKSIAEYQMLIVEMRVHLTGESVSKFAQHHDVVPLPQVSQEGEISYTRIVTTTGGAVNWYFDTDTSLTIKLILMPTSTVDDIYISKVYGLK